MTSGLLRFTLVVALYVAVTQAMAAMPTYNEEEAEVMRNTMKEIEALRSKGLGSKENVEIYEFAEKYLEGGKQLPTATKEYGYVKDGDFMLTTFMDELISDDTKGTKVKPEKKNGRKINMKTFQLRSYKKLLKNISKIFRQASKDIVI